MSEPREIIYEPHPVTPERKAELRAAGYQIIDAIYAPAGYVHPDAVAPEPKGNKPAKGESKRAAV